MNHRSVVRLALGTGTLLLAPLLAMQFTDEVDWALGDFIAAGALVFGAGLTYQLVAPRVPSDAWRAFVAVAVTATLLLVWIGLAVDLP